MEPKTFQLLLFAALVLVMPVIYFGLVPIGMFTVMTLRATWDALGSGQSTPWLLLLIGSAGMAFAWIAAVGCSACIERRWAGRTRVQIIAVLAVLLAGALPIYGASWHGPPEFTNAYLVYSTLLGNAAL